MGARLQDCKNNVKTRDVSIEKRSNISVEISCALEIEKSSYLDFPVYTDFW